jgi:hypothetical protein
MAARSMFFTFDESASLMSIGSLGGFCSFAGTQEIIENGIRDKSRARGVHVPVAIDSAVNARRTAEE